MNFEWLYRGTPGHPLHPPLTDATIGTYTFATVAAVLSKVGIAEEEAAQGWALALIVGLLITGPTALTGLADWIRIERGTALFRTATAHMIAMLLATALFLVSIGAGYSDGIDGVLPDGAFILTLAGFLMLDGRRLARRLDRLQLRHARAEPGRGTGEPCGLTGPPPGGRSRREVGASP